MNLLIFAASNSRASINAKLVRFAADRFVASHAASARIKALDLNDFEMPIYSIDREAESGVPEAAHAFLAEIGDADAIFISFAEHNGTYTVAWKNIFDWMSRLGMKVFQDKPMVILATSPGGRGGSNVLSTAKTALPFFGGDVKGAVSVASWNDAYDQGEGGLVRAEDLAALDDALASLAQAFA